MRKRFEQQLKIRQLPIADLSIGGKRQGKLEELLAALKAIYCNPEYNNKLFIVLEKHLTQGKHKTGREGMSLWSIFCACPS